MTKTRRSVLRERDLVVLAVAQFVSVAGDTAAIVALGLRLHADGGGGWTIAALLLAGTAPLALLSPVAGALADRFDSRRVIRLSVLVQAALAAVLAVVHDTAAILVLIALLETAGSIVVPATGALVPRIVGEDRIPDATAVTQTSFVMGNLVGPALGGALAGAFGTAAPLALDAVSFLAVAVAISLVRTRRRPAAGGHDDANRGVRSGWRTVRGDSVLLSVVIVMTLLILVCGAVNVADLFLMKDALATSDAVYGLVAACWMAGMMVGSAVTPRLGREIAALLRTMLGSVFVVAIGLTVAGAAPSWPVAAAAFVVGGIGNGGLAVSTQTVVVRRAPEAQRARVLGVLTGSINTALVLAFVAGGAFVSALGPRVTVVGCGVAAAVVGVAFVPLTRRAATGRQGDAPADTVPTVAAPTPLPVDSAGR